jgi:hypothetical protein
MEEGEEEEGEVGKVRWDRGGEKGEVKMEKGEVGKGKWVR